MYDGSMRYGAALLVLVVVGCQFAQPLVGVTVKGIQDEDVPTRVVLEVTNLGDETVAIEATPPIVSLTSVLHDDASAEDVRPDFDYRTTLLYGGKPLRDGATIPVAVGETVELVVELRWQRSDDAPPLVGLMQASFTAASGRRTFGETDPVALIVQSQPGALEAVWKAAEMSEASKRRAMGVLSQYSGSPSPSFKGFCRRLTGKDYHESIGPAAPSGPSIWVEEPPTSR